MVVSDHEIDQLYADRYRLDQLFQNSPEFRDSLENSSVTNSLSVLSQVSDPRSRNQTRPPKHLNFNSDRLKIVEAAIRNMEGRNNQRSEHPIPSPQWPHSHVDMNQVADSNPRNEPPPLPPPRRPQNFHQPGFSYIYPNAEPEKNPPPRRFSFMAPSNRLLPEGALPFKGKLEYFDRLSRNSTPEPGASPFTQEGISKVGSPLLGNTPRHSTDSKQVTTPESGSRMEGGKRPSLTRLQNSRGSNTPSSPLTPGSEGSQRHLRQTHTSPSRSPDKSTSKENISRAMPPPPPPQILFSSKLLRSRRKSPNEPNTNETRGFSNHAHLNKAWSQEIGDDAERRNGSTNFAEVKKRVIGYLGEESNTSINLRVNNMEGRSRDMMEGRREKNEERGKEREDSWNEEGKSGESLEARRDDIQEPRNARSPEKASGWKNERDNKENIERGKSNNQEKRGNGDRGSRENLERGDRLRRSRNNLGERGGRGKHERDNGANVENHKREKVDQAWRETEGSQEVKKPSRSKLQRRVSSPSIPITRSLAVGQSKISDSVNQISDSVTQLKRSLSRKVGRSVSQSIGRSFSRSLTRKYKRQYDNSDEYNQYHGDYHDDYQDHDDNIHSFQDNNPHQDNHNHPHNHHQYLHDTQHYPDHQRREENHHNHPSHHDYHINPHSQEDHQHSPDNHNHRSSPPPSVPHRGTKNHKTNLSRTFSTLRRTQVFNHSGLHYQMLFGDSQAKNKDSKTERGKPKTENIHKNGNQEDDQLTERRDQKTDHDQRTEVNTQRGPKELSEIHRFFHIHENELDSKSQKSHKSTSLPHPNLNNPDRVDSPAVSIHERHPEKFWTFTTSVVLPDYEQKSEAYPDHPERDSLDGHLPGSSHGTGNPPPPPTPPSPPASSAKPTAAFTKGPNAKNKKHKKLKNEADEPSGGSGGTTSEGGGGGGGQDNHTRKKKDKTNADDKDKDRDMEAGGGYRPKTEPYSYLWVVLSGLYGKLVVLLMLAFCLTEVLDNSVTPFTFQGVFLMYLYVGSILAIMCIYVTVIVDNCPSVSASKENLTKQDDPEVGSITSFGTLKRAHISRSKTSRTSFYLRVGALVFGLGTLIFNGLEIAMHSTMQGECVKDIVFAHPILQALFTFLQMHFLFVNSEVIVEKFGRVARFGFMHLVATNIAVWVRMVVWESATVWIEDMYAGKPLGEVPGQAEQVLRLYNCFNNNSLGRLWTDAQPYLFPFLVQYSLIAAAVTYVMWCNVGNEKLKKLGHLAKAAMEDSATLDKRGIRKGYWKVDCRSASKGLFLGLLCLVGGIVVLIIFFVMKDQEEFKTKMFWICNGTQTIILSLSVINTVIGFLQIPKLSVSTSKPLDLDRLLLSSTIAGVYVFAIFGMIVGGVRWDESEYLATFCLHALLLVQVSLQDMLVAEASRRTCTSRYQMLTKPGRQVITFLLFSNITLWILDTFMTHTSVTQNFQYGFYGVLAWGVISRISLPLLILYRFHSAVILVEIWKNTYRTKAD